MNGRAAIGYRKRQLRTGWRLLLLTTALLAPLGEPQGERIGGQSSDRLSRLVQIVAEANETAQQDFTWIALSELAAAYEKVMVDSRSEAPKDNKARAKLISWRNGTQRFLAQLYGLLERLDGSVEIQMQAAAAGPPVIYVNGEPVVISGPEIGGARLMERRIIDNYCAMHDCSELSGPDARRPAVDRTPGGGIWTLKNFGKASYATPDGLIFTFSGVSRRSEKQKSCEVIAAELRSLAAGLRGAMDAGHSIDWYDLIIQPLSDDRGHRVLFNRTGEYLRMELPVLSLLGPRLPGTFSWIKQKALGDTPAGVEIFADHLPLNGVEE